MLDKKPTILVIDDDEEFQGSLRFMLNEYGKMETALSPDEGLERIRIKDIDLAIVDLRFEGQDKDGIYALDKITELHPTLPFIILSGDTDNRRLIKAGKYFSIDFVPKGLDLREELKAAVERGLERTREMRKRANTSPFETKSPIVKGILDYILQVASGSKEGSFLITGEPGTGKEKMAHFIAAALKLELFPANMAGLSKDLIDAELFGSVKGSYTGSIRDMVGVVARANNNALFLDEIGDCPLDVQAKLLRTLQEGEIKVVGEDRPRKVKVRFIAATNKDLHKLVHEKSFRQDFLDRLNVFPVAIPALRQRKEDILFYANKFLMEFAPEKRLVFTKPAEEVLLNYHWPGNIRELRAVVNRICPLAKHSDIDERMVRLNIDIGRPPAEQMPVDLPLRGAAVASVVILPGSAKGELPPRTRQGIAETLKSVGNNRQRAADIYGVDKTTFYRWLKKTGLDRELPPTVGRPRLEFCDSPE